MPINHMVVVSEALSESIRKWCEKCSDCCSRARALRRPPRPRFSAEEMRRSLEMIIRYTAQQGLIPRAFAVDELFDDVTRALR